MCLSIRFVLAFLGLALLEAKLPTFIDRCHLSDPQFEKCLLENGKKAVSYIIHGVEELQIPPLTKLKVPILKCVVNEGFVLTFTGFLEGLHNIEFENSIFQKGESKGTAKAFIPNVKLVGKCLINGTIGDMNINSEGNCVMKFDLVIIYDYVLPIFGEDVLKYMKFNRPLLVSHSIDRASYRFSKFFGSNTAKRNKLNILLHQEHDVLGKVLGPIVADNILEIMFDVSKKIYGSAPINELFLP